MVIGFVGVACFVIFVRAGLRCVKVPILDPLEVRAWSPSVFGIVPFHGKIGVVVSKGGVCNQLHRLATATTATTLI